ncbi:MULTISPECIES: GH1 family beta-glucosidase [unclassified Undibacterium]|uniref:GH1 family beta-glucosidase n=1 Tax=unclassified Undibacterium TaxID=2630295 RepID=UPI002AC89794|nr:MULTISPECIES: GH1 family beta-glucosidase [unclassified Undibacterium]MEB0139261.1 GH1 family beta-glucosidase [Undibacterium sp. CCC2.1]MEB0172105.1 GH1 family beta-glucosidase [Undibacterium sp. CCC1.1]MEB0175980.1 GH1 family beta-glucosidase [Undibacterium sp. CCC3.4]MEB0215292.1 GH1 family beta-glucosidase [Undibacterium sp. 5I2]WPX45466.1 GH1 family beta-glucosidase [Undibacterium sp. CCC3.4]
MPTTDSKLAFPRTFSWGVATSAYQIEGAAAEDGRGPSIWDSFTHAEGNIIDGSSGDVACDHYHRYPEDVELIADLGVDAYRFSISWSRVQPLGYGAWNEAGFAFYAKLLDRLAEKNIAAHVTLYHWDLPQGLQDLGGWLSRETTQRFAEYAAEVARRFGSRVASIATHNEPWCTANLGYGNAQFAPGVADTALSIQVSHHLLLSHGLAIQAMRAVTGAAGPQYGIVLNQWTADAATSSAADEAEARWEYARSVQWFMDPIFKGEYPQAALARMDLSRFHVMPGDMDNIRQPLDFLGVNYYFRAYISTETPQQAAPAALGLTDMGWEIYPQGLTRLLVGLQSEYPDLPPIYITENGMAAADQMQDGAIHDSARIDYVRLHLQALQTAMAAGVDVRGYFYWSLLDNFEWNSGYAKRFGLVYVDYATQERVLKDSAHWYRNLIAEQQSE